MSRREARWWERLSCLDLEIEHRLGKKNPADGPSRRRDYGIEAHAEDKAGGRARGTSPSLGDEVLKTRNWALISTDDILEDNSTSTPNQLEGDSQEFERNTASTGHEEGDMASVFEDLI